MESEGGAADGLDGREARARTDATPRVGVLVVGFFDIHDPQGALEHSLEATADLGRRGAGADGLGATAPAARRSTREPAIVGSRMPSKPASPASNAERARRAPTSTSDPVVALLRGVNVGGHKKVPMAELRELAAGLGARDVATYIQSGNLVASIDLTPAELEVALERAIEQRFGFAVEVVARTATQWRAYASGSPFPDAEGERPNLVLLGLSKRPPAREAALELRARATAGERVELRGDAIWMDLPRGSGTSKLTPAALDRAAGSAVTTRNWRTVQKLAELLSRVAASTR